MPLPIPTAFGKIFVTGQAEEVTVFENGRLTLENLAYLRMIDDRIHHSDKHIGLPLKVGMLSFQTLSQLGQVLRIQGPSLIFTASVGLRGKLQFAEKVLLNVVWQNAVGKDDVEVYSTVRTLRISDNSG